MQRKALKQLNKVTQWTNEKVFSGERTEFSEQFAEFEQEVEPLKIGVERLHATSVAFYDQLAKVKPSADPYPPSGSSKDKLRVSEALGLVMIDYGNDAGGAYGDALVQYGHARVKIAGVQDEFSQRFQEGFVANTEAAMESVNEYKAYRKKMDSRRLTLDSALHRAKQSKKENPALEQEVEVAMQRFEEAEEETHLRMQQIKKQEEEQFAALVDWLEAEADYYSQCKAIIDDLRSTFPSNHEASAGRPRAKSTASARSAGKTPTRSTYARRTDSEDELPVVEMRSPNRSRANSKSEGRQRSGSKSQSQPQGRERSDSGASAGKPKGRSIMQSIGSIGSFGMKSASSAGKAATKAGKSTFKSRNKYGNLSDEERERVALDSDDDPYKRDQMERDWDMDRDSPSPTHISSRARSQSVVSVVSGLPSLAPPDTRRRALTSPPSPAGRFVKVLFDYDGNERDELSLRRGQIIEVKSEVSPEWLMGECAGQSGMFPKSYTEEHIMPDKPAIPARPAMQKQRSLPPREFKRNMPPPTLGRTQSFTTSLDSGSEHNIDLNEDGTGLASAAQPTPTSVSAAARSRSGSVARKPAPPPPPSRRAGGGRSRSSTLSRGTPLASDEDSGSGMQSGQRSGQLSPARYTSPKASAAPAARSPFEHSDDEDLVAVQPQPLAHGLAAMHLDRRNANGASTPDCDVCGCSDFTQNVFKANGVCASCFHQH